jgi:hypothetical protein
MPRGSSSARICAIPLVIRPVARPPTIVVVMWSPARFARPGWPGDRLGQAQILRDRLAPVRIAMSSARACAARRTRGDDRHRGQEPRNGGDERLNARPRPSLITSSGLPVCAT